MGHCLLSVSTLTLLAETIPLFLFSDAQLIPSFSQLHENYVLKSADGLSITFVYIWLAGDALNGLGALRQGLLWTMVSAQCLSLEVKANRTDANALSQIILAMYYVLCDVALIAQYYYYRRYYKNGIPISPPGQDASASSTERTPLLNGTAAAVAIADEQGEVDPATAAAAVHAATIEDDSPASWKAELIRYFLALSLVFLTGVLAWYFSSTEGDGGKVQKPPSSGENRWKWDAQIFGWASALLYRESSRTELAHTEVAMLTCHCESAVSSRIPQIAKNRHTKCEGLSVALFLFAVMGNVTYVAVRFLLQLLAGRLNADSSLHYRASQSNRKNPSTSSKTSPGS